MALSLSEKVEIFTHRMKDSISVFIKSVRLTKSKDDRWYDEELKRQRIKRDVSYKIAVILSSKVSWERYKHERNVYSWMLRDKKKAFIEGKLNDANGDSKRTWKILKQLLHGNKNAEISSVEINGVKETTAENIGEKLNEFFVESVEQINRSIIPPTHRPKTSSQNFIGKNLDFTFTSVSRQSIEKFLSVLKNKRDVDYINPKIIIDSMAVTGHLLEQIVNESLNDGQVPDIL